MSYSTTRLIESIRNRSFIAGTSQTNLWTTARIMALIDDEITGFVAPIVLSTVSGYYNVTKDYSLVASRAAYVIPPRAIGNTLVDVLLNDGVSNIDLPYVDPALTEDQRQGFYLENGQIVITPTPSGSNASTLRLRFSVRPSQTIDDVADLGVNYAVITVISGKVITFAATPSAIVTGTKLDLMQSQSGFALLAVDETYVSKTSTTITLTNTPPATLAVGDYVCVADKTPIPHCPDMMHPLLACRVSEVMLRAQDYAAEADRLHKDVLDLERKALSVIQPRVQSENKKVRGGILANKKLSWPIAR